MNGFETPMDFSIRSQCGNDVLEYRNLLETGQSGPVIGDLFINGHHLAGYRFGGPVICHETGIYAPVFVKKFLFRGFMLAIIDRRSLTVDLVAGSEKDMIFLDRIEDGKIYFFEDGFKRKANFFNLGHA